MNMVLWFSPECSLATLPPHRLSQFNFLPHIQNAEVNFSACLYAPVLSECDSCCPCATLDYVVPSRTNDVSHSPVRVAVTLGGMQSAPGLLRQAGGQGSLSMHYGGSRMSQKLSKFIVQFTVLCFCKRG
jgi:hypothetical protein